jgi:hypothetical protein
VEGCGPDATACVGQLRAVEAAEDLGRGRPSGNSLLSNARWCHGVLLYSHPHCSRLVKAQGLTCRPADFDAPSALRGGSSGETMTTLGGAGTLWKAS